MSIVDDIESANERERAALVARLELEMLRVVLPPPPPPEFPTEDPRVLLDLIALPEDPPPTAVSGEGTRDSTTYRLPRAPRRQSRPVPAKKKRTARPQDSSTKRRNFGPTHTEGDALMTAGVRFNIGPLGRDEEAPRPPKDPTPFVCHPFDAERARRRAAEAL